MYQVTCAERVMHFTQSRSKTTSLTRKWTKAQEEHKKRKGAGCMERTEQQTAVCNSCRRPRVLIVQPFRPAREWFNKRPARCWFVTPVSCPCLGGLPALVADRGRSQPRLKRHHVVLCSGAQPPFPSSHHQSNPPLALTWRDVKLPAAIIENRSGFATFPWICFCRYPTPPPHPHPLTPFQHAHHQLN
jgi:hypothetical protein